MAFIGELSGGTNGPEHIGKILERVLAGIAEKAMENDQSENEES